MIKLALKFIAETLVRDGLSTAGQQIGEAIGKRIGKHIHVEEPEEETPVVTVVATPADVVPGPVPEEGRKVDPV